MKSPVAPSLWMCLLLPAVAGVPVEPPKTNSANPVDPALQGGSPYIFNGIVESVDLDEPGEIGDTVDRDRGKGSGVVAWNAKTFFTTAHLVYDKKNGFIDPPKWQGTGSSETLRSRGYFRWMTYRDSAKSLGQTSTEAYSKDMIVAWGMAPFISGEPAVLDFNGYQRLKNAKEVSMITGYPATLDYTGEFAFGLHATTEQVTTFVEDASRYLHATHISVGPGGCGGPIWLKDKNDNWKAAGVLSFTRPSESGICSFNPATKSLTKAVAPLVGDVRKSVNNNTPGVSTSVGHYVLAKPKKIPDGKHQWTKIPFSVNRFEENTEIPVTGVTLDLTVTTNHVGDLMVAVMAPTGAISGFAHDGQGADDDNLVLDGVQINFGLDDFNDLKGSPNGTWNVLVQDRLTGDICTVTRCELNILVYDKPSSGEAP